MVQAPFFRLLERLESGKEIPPYILLHGFNESLGEIIIQTLCDRFLEKKNDFNYRRYYFDRDQDDAWEEIIGEARSASFFLQAHKIIVAVVREEKKVKLSKADRSLVLDYLAKPNPHTIMVHYISMDLSKDDYRQARRGKIAPLAADLASAGAHAVDLDAMSEREVTHYIKRRLQQQGITITASALEKMFDLTGEDFASIIGQLPKLELSVDRERSLDTEDVEHMITGIESHSIWELTEAIEREDVSRYLDTLKYLFINGIKPHFILGTLIAHYNKIFTAKFLLKHNFPLADIGKVLQQPQFLMNKFIQSVRGFSEIRLQRILRVIYHIDLELKTGGDESARLLLQNFIFQIRHLSPRTRSIRR